MEHLEKYVEDAILNASGANRVARVELIQHLWSGYGKILRVRIEGGDYQTVIAKHICLEGSNVHPRGWNSDRSHDRKVKSYEVETAWYLDWAHRCDDSCRIPRLLAREARGEGALIVLEDLDAAGYPERMVAVEWPQLTACLSWLANFHATFVGTKPEDLWEVGTYWHLDTRRDELEAMEDSELRGAARAIDEKLRAAKYQTLVHGDAKLANFCFSAAGDRVAAVDFQYVGGGCGMKDLAYFVGSCLDEAECEAMEDRVLDHYFTVLDSALERHGKGQHAAALIAEWRELFPVAWTDFHRFIKGWSPGHWKINSYSERVAKEVVAALGRRDPEGRS